MTSKDPFETPATAYLKALTFGKRLPELEDIILTDVQYACGYACLVIKGRWEEAEDVIMNSPMESLDYARCGVEGKLPDKMHKRMSLYAIIDPSNPYVKEYFEFIDSLE